MNPPTIPAPRPDGPVSVLVAEDHPVYLEALVDALASRPAIGAVVAVARGRDALRELRSTAIDVALLDLRLPDMDGLAILRTMRLEALRTRAVVLSNESASDIVHAAVSGGAVGYLTKSATRSTICAAVEAAAADRATFDGAAMANLAAAVRADGTGLDGLGRRERRIVDLLARGVPTTDVAEQLGMTTTDLRLGISAIYTAAAATTVADPARSDTGDGADARTGALTLRELEVLGHLPSSLSAAQIASELFVSPNTVRTHIKAIHRKLAVTNRTDAVRRARDLGLIPPARGRPG